MTLTQINNYIKTSKRIKSSLVVTKSVTYLPNGDKVTIDRKTGLSSTSKWN